nr:serine/threonine-protein kinase [Flexivirga aerilata]
MPGYEVVGPIGRGATGTVWTVRSGDGVRLAAKVLAADAGQLDYEIAVLESIRHAHVVRLVDVVLDAATEPPGLGLVMELAEGGSLAETLARRGVLTPGELVTVLCPVARALHDLHGLGLVHGDLSPGNILLTGEGKPLIGDLGMSRLAGHTGDEVWATEAWAAPEVLAGGAVTPASDVYSLGAIAWRALTGAPPEPAALRADLATLAPEVPEQLRDLVNAALAHTDSARPLPGEFALSLWGCADPEPAPVHGSPGRRAASAGADQDPAESLTRRIRAEAAHEEAAEHPRRDRRRSSGPRRRTGRRLPGGRWSLAAAGVLGVAGAVLFFGVPRTSSAPDRIAGPGPATAAPSAASSRKVSGPLSKSPPKSPSSPRTTPSPTAVPAGLGDDPVAVVQALADARAAAWGSGDQDRLDAALVPGSVAAQRDRTDLGKAAAAGAKYSGLAFRVRSATVRPTGGDTAHVTAVIDRSAYQVQLATGRRTVPAGAAQRTEVSVQLTKDGWRIADWRAPG